MARLFRRSGEKKSLWQRIKEIAFTDVNVLMRGLDEGSLERLEELLLASDFGVEATLRLVDHVEALTRRGEVKTEGEFQEAVRREIRTILTAGNADPALRFAPPGEVTVFLIAGVNGAGKTTTIGKLAYRLKRQGHRVLLAAADTFRAGAIDQLRVWAERVGTEFVGARPGADPAAVAFDAIDAARARGADVVIIDTAGRLHTHSDLMAELAKIERVVARKQPGAPHETLLVLDATIGQNAIAQARMFGQALKLTGLVLAKLDSTAKGGIVVALKQEFGLPVKLVGVGEDVEDLEPFDADVFAREVLTA
ncbi:MAG: signal recognition particle-docking protein FtsY [bacterium]|jgi:fused signal recognition particle receptor|nr:MAG: signal recognition particle-docking protein FtsY [bacterium]